MAKQTYVINSNEEHGGIDLSCPKWLILTTSEPKCLSYYFLITNPLILRHISMNLENWVPGPTLHRSYVRWEVNDCSERARRPFPFPCYYSYTGLRVVILSGELLIGLSICLSSGNAHILVKTGYRCILPSRNKSRAFLYTCKLLFGYTSGFRTSLSHSPAAHSQMTHLLVSPKKVGQELVPVKRLPPRTSGDWSGGTV